MTWDAIVIGSGLGGLTCAATLCAMGRRTLVLEGHYVAGGNSQAFRRQLHGHDYEFDVGVHYIGECGPDGLIHRIYDGLGLAERVIFRPLDPDGYSTLLFPDLEFRVPASWERYRARLLETFPDEADPLGRVVDTLREVARDGRRFQRREFDVAQLGTEAPTFAHWGLRPVTDLFAEHGLSRRAQAVLLGEQGDYAVRPSKTPTALAAGLTDHYMSGAFYPEGGGQAMAARLIEAIRAYGGEVRTRAPVERVRVENGRVLGVTLARGGGEIDAPVVVSNADLKRTVLELVGESHFDAATVERVRGYRMTLPLFAVYVGLDVDLRAQGAPNTNYWIWDSDDIEGIYDRLEKGEIPDEHVTYVTVTSVRDPASRHIAPPGHTNLQVMTVVPHDYGLWNVERGPHEGERYHRDPEYRRRKAALTERVLAAAERVVPDLRAHAEWSEAATPITQERFTHSTGGTSYGIEYATDQMGPLRIGPRTELAGLFLCGASTPSGHGISNVMWSGVRAASEVLESDVGSRLLAGERIGDSDRLPPLRADWDAWRESH
ncbi:MAG: NAD(P)/FAD-dependent oxidoreductase [Myxococcota bacterium]|nr:NAD(P)/FAD-dependent oxidoreductase [Myxococcota bacterium]